MRNICLALLLSGVVGVGCAGSGDDDDNSGPGSCDTEAGEIWCDPICVNGRTDVDNCGACGRQCDEGDVCAAGICTAEGTDTSTGTDTDTGSDTQPPGACDDNCIDVADPGIPDCSDIGANCRDNRDCELGFFCVPDANGWPDGYCLAGGPVGGGACDPNLPASCPDGSSCIYNGTDADGIQYYYCFKDCNISDRNPWDASSCGCRDGYECSLTDQICLPGCTEINVEDDCCQYWADPNGDFINDGAAEFEPVPGCTQTCNEAAYRCVNPGDPDANWGDACLYQQDCPGEGACLRERDQDGAPGGDHFFIGGMCTRFGCDLDGRECGTNGGPDATDDDCRNLGSADDPFWVCVKTCNITETEGGDPFAANVECGADYNCFPDGAEVDSAHNGYCWTPPRLNDIRVSNVGGPCDDNVDCFSPFGQGFCVRDNNNGWTDGVCMIGACDFPGMEGQCPEADAICDPLFSDLSVCLDRCTDPGGGFGTAAGCRDDNWACYTSSVGDDTSGRCLPSCATQDDPDGFCGGFWGGLPNCDLATGICVP